MIQHHQIQILIAGFQTPCPDSIAPASTFWLFRMDWTMRWACIRTICTLETPRQISLVMWRWSVEAGSYATRIPEVIPLALGSRSTSTWRLTDRCHAPSIHGDLQIPVGDDGLLCRIAAGKPQTGRSRNPAAGDGSRLPLGVDQIEGIKDPAPERSTAGKPLIAGRNRAGAWSAQKSPCGRCIPAGLR